MQRQQTPASHEQTSTDPAVTSRGHARYALGVLVVVYVFNMIDRIADALDFEVPSRETFARRAGFLLERGYR